MTRNSVISTTLAIIFIASLALNWVPATFHIGHNHEHHHGADHCENVDPCHLTVHHYLSDNSSCEHDAHFIEEVDVCELCQFFQKTSEHQTILNSSVKTIYFQLSDELGGAVATAVSAVNILQSLRGPPALV